MNTQAMHEASIATQEGRMTFPQVVGKLLEIGVESYLVDFAAGRKTYYLGRRRNVYRSDDSQARSGGGGVFRRPDLVAAIRGAQADTVRYPEFVKRSTAAGVIGYWAFLTGKRVIYFGRKGESHVEYFPGAKPQP